jgi:hypothetical protein
VVALKVVPPATARNAVLMQRFEREFKAASLLDHPNIVKAIEYCGTGPAPFLVMEFVDGESLGQRVERAGAIPEADAVRLIAQVCDGLHKAHKQGLIHRDVKPDNILVNREGDAKLTDMGLVKDMDGDLSLTKTGRGLGTPHFMAPEQFRNAKNADVRCDIYSLGATLYMMVTGKVPFANANPLDCWMRKIRNEFAAPRDLNPRLSERVDWAVRRAMSADPAQRPASCREFVEDLTGLGRQAAPAANGTPSPAPAADLWYMVYTDADGETHTVKGTTDGIRNAVKDQLLGDLAGVLVCRTKAGPFQPVKSVPEFRDLVVAPAPVDGPGSGRVTRTATVGSDTGTFVNPAALAPPRRPDDPSSIDLGAPLAAGSAAGRSASGKFGPQPSGRHSAPQFQPTPLASPASVAALEAANPSPAAAGPGQPPEKSAADWTPWLLIALGAADVCAVVLSLVK